MIQEEVSHLSSMEGFEYILVTLIGGHKLYSMPLFWEYVEGLNVQPVEIIVSCTKEVYDQAIESYHGVTPVRHIHGEGDLADDHIHSTTAAREALRQELITLPYEWSLWLDNDMLVPPEMIEQFSSLIETEPLLLWVNAFHPARQKALYARGGERHGLGSSFIHKELLEAVPFIHYRLRGKNLGDDYLWKLIATQFMTNFKSIMCGISGRLFNVKHAVEDGSIHTFNEKIQRDIDELYSS